jgi:two-component system sensor histidine kinase ChvG
MALRLRAPIRRPQRFFTRISVRLMAFNLLLVFLPVGAILYLGAYETHLVDREYASLHEQAALVAASLERDARPLAAAASMTAGIARKRERELLPRFRVVDLGGSVVADSLPAAVPAPPPKLGRVRRNWLYRAGSAIGRPVLRLLRLALTGPRVEENEPYEHAAKLGTPEVRDALHGKTAQAKRFDSRRRLVVLSVAVPLRDARGVAGVVIAERTTAAILRDLSALRLGVLRIFMASVVVAMLISFFVAMTIVRPLRQLRFEAARIDRHAGPVARFTPSRSRDEIGALSRSLDRLTRRLTGYARFMDRFASDLSHEMKNPLASVRTATEMLAEIDDPAERRRFRRMIEQDIARMEHLLDDVREITSVDTGLLREPRAPVAVDALLMKIADGMRMRERGRITIELEAAEGLPPVSASEERLIQVFENVLDNAVSFSRDGGRVLIELLRDGNAVVVRIRDEGPGIPAEHLGRIFDRFFTWRPDQPKRMSRHTGLGLAIVKRIIEGYGGTITAANGEAGGAVFEIRLPA